MSLTVELDDDAFGKLTDFALEGAEVVVIVERLVQPRPATPSQRRGTSVWKLRQFGSGRF
jgi:hypothetical protein